MKKSQTIETLQNTLEGVMQEWINTKQEIAEVRIELEETQEALRRNRNLLYSYKELSERGCEESIEKMAKKLHEFCLQDTNETINLGVRCGFLKIIDLGQGLVPWDYSKEETKDTYRVHITKIITKDNN